MKAGWSEHSIRRVDRRERRGKRTVISYHWECELCGEVFPYLIVAPTLGCRAKLEAVRSGK